jgi:hypothetical protein
VDGPPRCTDYGEGRAKFYTFGDWPPLSFFAERFESFLQPVPGHFLLSLSQSQQEEFALFVLPEYAPPAFVEESLGLISILSQATLQQTLDGSTR